MAEQTSNWELGQNGEELAADYLMKQGFQILHHNWNLHRGCELDLVAMKYGELHFVEVKTRSQETELFGRPEQAIDAAKLRNLMRAIRHYVATYHLDCPMHVDAIGVIYRSEQDFSINFMPDIAPYSPPVGQTARSASYGSYGNPRSYGGGYSNPYAYRRKRR